MAVTAEDLGAPPTERRTDLTDHQGRAVCGAKKKSGMPCMAVAGQGTDHLGFGACKQHGGSTSSGVKRAAKEQVAAKVDEMIKSGEIDYVTPEQALMADVTRAAYCVAYWDDQVNALDDIASSRGQVIINQWNEQRRLLHQAAKIVIASGIAKRHVEVAEFQAMALMQALLAVIGSPEMALSPQQQAMARTMLGQRLRAISVDSVDVA